MPRASSASRLPADPAPPTALPFWRTGTIAAAVCATAVEAALIQQKKAFFTGGFLAGTSAAGPGEALMFLAVSVLVDASIAGALVVMLLWLTSRMRLTPWARLTLVTAGALAPIIVWDFITYSLLTYLGDAFDLELMFDLVGRDTAEVMAVASAHLWTASLLVLVAAAGLGLTVWTVNRLSPGPRTRVHVPRRLAPTAAALLLAGIGTTALASRVHDVLEDGLRRKASGNSYTRLIAAATDFDGDGFGIGDRTSDPAPFDSAIYPYAPEVPGNGIDENGVGGDLPAGGPPYQEPSGPVTWRHRPPVVFIVLESFRGDLLEAELDGRAVTPVLRALAAEGASSARAFSHNGYTVQSRYHLFSGSLAGLRSDGTIVDDFKANGYEVAYFSGQDESFGGPKNSVGFDRADVAYDARQDRDSRYSTFSTAGSLAVPHRTVEARLSAFLTSRDQARPLFLYVNFHDTHYPYHHRGIQPLLCDTVLPQGAIGPGNRDRLREMYLNTAANVDAAIGRTLEMVAAAVGRPPAVIVTADHGESLYDEGFLGHGYALNDVQTRIPLVIRGLPLEITEPFGQIELRDAIRLALDREDTDTPPRVHQEPGKVVFQYLGDIHRPRQISFTGVDGRTIYDFRDDRVTLPDGSRHRPAALAGPDAERFQALVHQWERMMIARQAAAVRR